MMHFLIRLSICCVLLWQTFGTQVKIMDVIPPRNGDMVNLTCTISTFTSPATWDDPGGTLSTCFNSGTCSPSMNGVRYSFSATSSSIAVTILNFSSSIDTFTWKCDHLGVFDTYRIKYAIPVTNVKLENSSGYVVNSTINIVKGRSMDFRCSTSPSGSRPRATFRWYKKEGNQLPSVITDQPISTVPEPQPVPGQPEVDLLISYSTLTLQGNTVFQNLYIFCEGRDVTNRSNYVQSGEIQLNIVYPPRVQLFPNNTEYNVTLGTRNFSFNCNIIEANPLPQTNRYTWLHETSVIPEQSVSSYTLSNVQQSDTGLYRCRAENDYGTGTSDSLNFNVQYGPTISGLDDIDVEEGGTVNVTCKVLGNPTPSVNWTRSDKVVSNSSLLMMTSISRLNGGNYTCTASSVLQPTGQSLIPMHVLDILRINVLYGPGNSTSINPNISVYEVEEDKTAQVIICSAICNPSCSYKWMRNNTHISSQGNLSLGVVHRNMSGRYDCEALNTILGQKSSTISLEVKVQYAPVVKIEAEVQDADPYIVKAGRKNVILMCEVQAAYPQPTLFVWTHNRSVVQNGSERNFAISEATREIDGIWGCKGVNNYGTPSEDLLVIDVQYGPLIQPIEDKTVNESQSYSVMCKVDANPEPISVSWTKNNNATFFQRTALLTINNVTRHDSGTYRCTAVNQIHPSGQDNETHNGTEVFYFNVQYGAEIESLSVVEGNNRSENSTATLSCHINSNPESSITWTKEETEGTLKADTFVRQSRLIFEHVQCLDTGNYTCRANNGLGTLAEAEIPLYVMCYPRPDYRSPPKTKVHSKRYGNASLIYTVISFPKSTFSWTFIGNTSENRSLPESATVEDNGLQSIVQIKNLSIDDFGFYHVMARNVLPNTATEIFELIQADVPEVPFNVTVIDVKQTSLTVQWVAGHNGGLEQTFLIMITAGSNTRSIYASDPGYGKVGTRAIEDLKPNTVYMIRMSANNSMGFSSVTDEIIYTTSEESNPDTNIRLSVAGIAGGIGGCLVVIVIVVGIFLWRRHTFASKAADDDLGRKLQERERPESGLIDNPVYDRSDNLPSPSISTSAVGTEYAVVVKSKHHQKVAKIEDPSNVYAQVEKTKRKIAKKSGSEGKLGNVPRGDIYENATIVKGSRSREDVYENSKSATVDSASENMYENPGATSGNDLRVNKDDLLYADLMLGPPTTKAGNPVIHGLENRTEYAKIAYGKRGEPLPESED